MRPTFEVLDFIYVNKFIYGLRLPLSRIWLWQNNLPQLCDVVVFRSKADPNFYLIKRVMGLPGDHVELLASGRVRINNQLFPWKKILEKDDYQIIQESCPSSSHTIQAVNQTEEMLGELDPIVYSVHVPSGEIVLFGDNRGESADSRVWGTLPAHNLIGQVSGIWLSCGASISGIERICDPSQMRWERTFGDFDVKSIQRAFRESIKEKR